MRQRNCFVGLWLNEQEQRHLVRQMEATGLTASALLRKLVMGETIRPRPPDTYAALLRELSAIGNNINQIAHWANAREGISQGEVLEAVALVHRAMRLVKETV